MYLVVGLGNPGKQYEATRHNMGFDTIDVLVERHKIPQGGVKFNAMYGSGFIGGEKVIFMKPLSCLLYTSPVLDRGVSCGRSSCGCRCIHAVSGLWKK